MPNHAMTINAANDPQPGDFWHEMLAGVCLVVARDGDHVCVCREKRNCESDPNRYYFDHPEWLSVGQFKNWLSYERIDGFWADLGSRANDVSSYASLIPNAPNRARPGGDVRLAARAAATASQGNGWDERTST